MAKIPTPYIPHFNPPVYHCRRTKEKPCIDGDLTKSFWQDAPWTADFVDIEGDSKPSPRYQTRAKMLWDEQYLYVGAQLWGDEIWATLTERDAVIFQDNDFEIFIDTQSSTHAYYEFEMNALNTIWDLFLPKPYRDGGDAVNGFQIKGLQSAVKIDGVLNDPQAKNRMWSVEIALPFKAFVNYHRYNTVTPTIGSFWRLNFSRVHWNVDVVDGHYRKKLRSDGQRPLPEENWVWAPTGLINIHYPELWGFLFFCDEHCTCSIPEDEHRKWYLRTLYYQQHAIFEETGAFSTDLSTNLTDLPIRIQVTETWFELSLPASDGHRRIYLYADGHTIIK